MNKMKSLLYISLMILMMQCQKKDMHLELEETACKNFKISLPSGKPYEWISDPSCGGTSVNASIRITFNYDGEQKCLDRILLSPKFYRSNNSQIDGISYNGNYAVSDPAVMITSNSVTLTFNFQFANTSDADALNTIQLKYHTENDLGAKSNTLAIRINPNCSTVDPSTYTVKKTVTATSNTISIKLFDDAAEDGDIVSVYLNGKWVLENHTLTKAGNTFTFQINSGSNDFVIFANNEGSSGPNTCGITINGEDVTLSPDLLTGEAIRIKL